MKCYKISNTYILSALLLLILSACTNPPQTLQVSAAASMSDAARSLVEAYKGENPGSEVLLHLAASGTIASQISQGAPVDVFISASEYHMQRLIDAGKVSGQHTISLCSNALVLVSTREKPLGNLEDLQNADIGRIGIGTPDYVPAGRYAEEILRSEGVYRSFEDKLVFGASVRQVLAWVESGQVDAGFVYRTDAVLVPDIEIAAEWDTIQGEAIIYPAGIITVNPHAEIAAEFFDFLQSDIAARILEKYGFHAYESTETMAGRL